MDRKEFETVAPSLRESIVRMVVRLVPSVSYTHLTLPTI